MERVVDPTKTAYRVGETAYHASSDMFATVVLCFGTSAMVDHPYMGRVILPLEDLQKH